MHLHEVVNEGKINRNEIIIRLLIDDGIYLFNMDLKPENREIRK